ncbi:ParA family protein [Photobacterium sp. GB-72]|nr:ParA family protein [Photobacterium sp. GB-72]
MLATITDEVVSRKKEFEAKDYYKRYSKNSLKDLPQLTRAVVETTISDMEADGYVFNKVSSGNTNPYSLTIRDIANIYERRGVPKYRSKYDPGFVIFVANLKGGVSKTVSLVNLAHGLRAHDLLLKEDLRILILDLDPQASATMFNNEQLAIADVECSSAQAILQNLSLEELKESFIKKTGMDGVDIIPASIDDAFIASDWLEICKEYWPEKNPYSLMQEHLINKVKGEYDFILVDTGPHLDALLLSSLASADLLMTPIPPAQVDFHSTLKYLQRLPTLLQQLVDSGVEPKYVANIGYMTKITPTKVDHKAAKTMAKKIFTSNMLDVSLPRLDGFERVGESFNTAISADPKTYDGSKSALASARLASFEFAYSTFEQIDTYRSLLKSEG